MCIRDRYVAYKIYEETIKEENDSSLSYHKPAKYSYTNNNTTNSKGTNGGTIIAVVAVIIALFLLFAKCSSTKRVLDEHLLFEWLLCRQGDALIRTETAILDESRRWRFFALLL